MADAEQPDYTTLTVQLLTAYVSNNNVPIDQLPGLIETTRAVLAKRDDVPVVQETPAEDFAPAVSVRKSLASREHIVSLIDGKPYKALKRHLSTHGLTPADYRARYGLAADYPMVAPAYSEARRETAKRLGLGRKRSDGAAAIPQDASASAVTARTAPKRRRKATANATTAA